jgi:2-polyprenyl-3-methyl-5-hydroxy-6-metoxy-1,4-benzoquinol methylase
MHTLSHCPVCNSENLKDAFSCIDHTTTQETFQVQTCTQCSFTLTNPRPEDDQLGKYYESKDYISHSNNQKGIFNRIYQMVRNHAIESKFNLINKLNSNGLILDYGCGTGEFLGYVQKQERTVLGVEPSEFARKQAIQNHQLKVLSLDEFPSISDHSASIISLWHVLEHVSNLRETLSKFHSILNDKGHLVIAVPNCSSKDAEIYGPLWAGYDVPRHLWHFTPRTMQELLESEGFKLLKMKGMPFDSFYVSLLSEKHRTGKMNPIRAFKNGLLSNWKARNNPGKTSSVIYIFQKK